jgi:hypothetical protein
VACLFKGIFAHSTPAILGFLPITQLVTVCCLFTRSPSEQSPAVSSIVRPLPSPGLARWHIAAIASVVLHAGLAGSLQQGWLSLGSGAASLGAGDASGEMFVPLVLGSQGTSPTLAQTPPPAIAPELLARATQPPEVPKGQQDPAFEPVAPESVLDDKPEELDDEPAQEPEVVLGIDDGSKDAKDWLGAAQATPHSAPLSTVNQPAWSIAPGLPVPLANEASTPQSGSATGVETSAKQSAQQSAQQAADQAAKSSPAPTPSQLQSPSEALSQSQPLQPALSKLQAEPKPTPQPAPEDELGKPRDPIAAETAAETSPTQAVDASLANLVDGSNTAQSPGQPAVPTETINPEDGSTSTPAQKRPSTDAQAKGGGTTGLTQGDKSDAESVATSTIPSLTFKPGTPLAAEGVRIRTVAPKFSITTRVAARPRNPLLELTFNREGKVIAGKFVEGRTSGYEDIDGPILDACMRWTATGKKLQELTAGDPRATLTVRITYLLQ